MRNKCSIADHSINMEPGLDGIHASRMGKQCLGESLDRLDGNSNHSNTRSQGIVSIRLLLSCTWKPQLLRSKQWRTCRWHMVYGIKCSNLGAKRNKYLCHTCCSYLHKYRHPLSFVLVNIKCSYMLNPYIKYIIFIHKSLSNHQGNYHSHLEASSHLLDSR